MKKYIIIAGMTSLSLMSFVVIKPASIANLSEVDSGTCFKTILESQTCYGSSVTTQDMHNTSIGGQYDPNEYGRFGGSWFKKYTLTVSAPTGWHFTGEPYLNCVQENEGSFRWNHSSAAQAAIQVTQRGPNYIKATVWLGSRSIIVNLACEATKD